MDTHTTNITDLPIDHIPQNTEIPENIPPQINRMDQQVYESHQNPKVTFNPNVESRIPKDNSMKESHKMIILASLLFILFNEPLFRNYIMNILVVIFGHSLKTETGTTSKIGNVSYGIFFGLVLYGLRLVIDIPSL